MNSPNNIVKETYGYVKQTFNKEGNFISQQFIAGDTVEFLDDQGNNIEGSEFSLTLYHSFEMENGHKD